MSKPDTNQASEDELRKTLLDKLSIIKYGEAYKWLFDVDKSKVDLWTKDLLALIRTEKLKLLAEVRERVQVNQKGQFEEDSTGNVCWYLDDLVEALKEMEAEL